MKKPPPAPPPASPVIQGQEQAIEERTRELRAANAALAKSEERYRHLVESAFDWVWEVDAQARYTHASPRVRDLLGYEPHEVLGRTPYDLMPEEEARRVRAVFSEIAAARRPFVALENLNRHRDGHLVVLETSGVPVLTPEGHLVGYRGMDRDITERKRLEERLRQAQKLEAIGQLAGGVAHDFNNILAAILMNLSVIGHHPNLDPETREGLRELEHDAKRAATLTRQLLMFSRRSVLDIKPLDLNEVVANLLKMLGRLIGENIQLQFHPQSLLPPVEGDAGLLEQVLMNLALNARDAMPKGGRLTITTDTVILEPAPHHAESDRRAGRFVRLSVTDTGCGMDDATLKRAFEPFFTTKPPGKGTGLGLATVYGLVAQHKGWVEAESQVFRGATFRVFLPVTTQPTVEPGAPTSPSILSRGHEAILLVEDDPAVRRMVAKSLRTLGYRVFEAANGREAVALWGKHRQKINLLLTDMVMPEGMTGLELAETLLVDKPALKAVISSGYSVEIVRHGMATTGGIVYLPKPYQNPLLGKTLRECLDRK